MKVTPIRISQKDKAEYNRLKNNARSKVRRIESKFGLDVSGDVPTPSLTDFKTRKDFNEWKETVTRFTNRHNPAYQFVKNANDVPISRKEITTIKKDVEKGQRLADKKAEALRDKDLNAYGKPIGKLSQTMDKMAKPIVPGISRPKDFDIDKVESRKDLETLKERYAKRADPETFSKRNIDMQKTFLTELSETFNSDADDVIDLLKAIPPDEFYELYLQNEEFDFKLFYPMEGVEQEESLKELKAVESVLTRYWAGKINFDLMGF